MRCPLSIIHSLNVLLLSLKKLKTLIGRSDIADFPKLKLFGIDIKVDSGAYTSSFHCHHIEEQDNLLKCQFLDPEHDKYHNKFFFFDDYSLKEIKSSNGLVETRYVIKTEIFIFNTLHPIKLTLTERGLMNYPVLLGRNFLSKKSIIDPSKKKLSYKNKIIKL